MDEQTLQMLFFASLGAGLLLDGLLAMRAMVMARWFRWTNNGLLFLINGFITRLAVPGGVLAVAAWAGAEQLGLLYQLAPPPWLALVLGVLLLDLASYGLHQALHRVPLLWRLHRTHHSDIDVDVTTGLRHHPAEALMTTATAALVVMLAGIPPEAVLGYTVLVIPVSMFSHSNWLLPVALDRWLRLLLVTPGMHRVHHSAWQPETDSNYGILFAFWDRLFGSYCHAPKAGYGGMQLGLERFRDDDAQILHRLLLNPLE